MSTDLWIGIIFGGIITIAVAFYFFKKSPSKEDFQELKTINQNAEESTKKAIEMGVEEIKENDQLSYGIYLNNLISLQFNRFLETKKLDKDLLLKELEGNKIETLYIIKQKEGDKQKLLRERIKILGFKHVTFGDWILPPRKLKDKSILKQKDGVKRWVESNLIKNIDANNFVNSVVIVNLSNIYDEEKGKVKRVRKIIGGVLKPTDLIPTEKLLSEIHKKNKISFKEIVQLPFIDVLVEQEHPEIAENLKQINNKLVEKIKEKLGLSYLNITDIKNISEEDLANILQSFEIKNSKFISKQILANVNILDHYFNNKIGQEIKKENSLIKTC